MIASDSRLRHTQDDLISLTDSSRASDAERSLRLAEDGYLWLPGLIPADLAAAARDEIADRMEAAGALDPVRPAASLPWAAGLPNPFFQETVDRQPAVAAAVRCAAVRAAIEGLYRGPAEPSAYLWTRPVPPGMATGVHIDQVYMGEGSPRILTTWCCLDAVPRRLGGLAVMPGSHRAAALAKVRATYGASDVDRDLVDGTFDPEPERFRERYGAGWDGRWASADYGAGDVMVFGMFLAHCSIVNETDRYRLSCDARWTPAGEPMDPRWFGPAPMGHHRWRNGAKIESMRDARQRWGV